MKKIVKMLAVAAGVLFAAVGCNQDQMNAVFDPAGAGELPNAAYFSTKSFSYEFSSEATGDQTLNLQLFRYITEGDATVQLSLLTTEASAPFYEIPQHVTFADGEAFADFAVTIHNVEKYAAATTYEARISVVYPEGFETKIEGGNYPAIVVSTTKELTWVPLYMLKDKSKLLSADDLTDDDYVLGPDGTPLQQTGTFTYNSLFEGDDPGLTVERVVGANVFRINHWGGDVDLVFSVNPEETVTYDGKEYMAVHVDEQAVGMEYGSYGMIYFADEGAAYGAAYYDEFPCFWDGNDTFVFIFGYYVEAGDLSYDEVETFVLD